MATPIKIELEIYEATPLNGWRQFTAGDHFKVTYVDGATKRFHYMDKHLDSIFEALRRSHGTS